MAASPQKSPSVHISFLPGPLARHFLCDQVLPQFCVALPFICLNAHVWKGERREILHEQMGSGEEDQWRCADQPFSATKGPFSLATELDFTNGNSRSPRARQSPSLLPPSGGSCSRRNDPRDQYLTRGPRQRPRQHADPAGPLVGPATHKIHQRSTYRGMLIIGFF